MLPIMALAFYIAFLPHQRYPYPVHIDEWVHLAYFKAALQAGGTTFADPFTGQYIIGISSNLEAGFHLFWTIFQRISGISWLTIFRYFPGVIFAFTVLSIYVFANRKGFGWEAALFTCLILTTVGILGPGFLVPVALGLLFIPLALFLAFHFRSRWSYVVLFIFTSFLLSIHAPSAVCLVIIIFPYVLLNLKGDFRHSLGISLAIVIPFLAPFPWIFSMLLPAAKGLLTQQIVPTYVDLPFIIKDYGHLPISLCLIGTFLLTMRGGKINYGLLLGLLALLIMLVAFFTLHYGIAILYERGLMFMMLMVGIVAGAGLAGIKNLNLPVKLPFGSWGVLIKKHTGKFVCLVLVGFTLAIGIPDRQDIPYYNMIDREDYQTFTWIEENLDENHNKAILDPWKATAFTAITGKRIYTRIHAFPMPTDEEAYRFLSEGSSDTGFLRENGISIVYTRNEVRNPDLIEVRKYVYLLEGAGSQ